MTGCKNLISRTVFYVTLAAVLLGFVFPFFWMIFGSLKPGVILQRMPPDWLYPPTLTNYRNVFVQTEFLFRTFNSFVLAASAVIAGMVLGLPAAHAIGRFGRHKLGFIILMVRMIPGISFLVPWFIIYRTLGILDSYLGIVASHVVLTLPLIIWIMIGFFEDVPVEIEEAAIIDGCSKWQTFLRVALPLTRAGIAAAFILAYIFSWNHFLFALILSGPRTFTLPVTVFEFMTYEEIDFGGIYAAATLITAPIIVLVLIIQNHFVEGLTMGGLKG